MNPSRSLDPAEHFSFRAWLCDLDGTLYRQTPIRAAMAAELAIAGWGSLGVLRKLRHELECLRADADCPPGDPFLEQVRRVATRSALPPERVEAVARDWMVRKPGKWLRWFRRRDLLERISRFRAAGGRTAVVSDYPARDKLRAMGIDQLFDVVVASGEADGPPRLKPSPEGYLLAADRLGIDPADCLVIGDRADADGLAAERAGMRFHLVGGRMS